MWDRGLLSVFCICFSNFSSTIGWRGYPFSTGYSWLPCWILVDRICQGLILGSLFCSVGQFVFFPPKYNTVFPLWFCGIAWNPEVWYLWLCSFLSRLLWLFEVFCGSTHILGLFLLFLWRMPLEFWSTVIIVAGKNWQWMVKLAGKSMVRNRKALQELITKGKAAIL